MEKQILPGAAKRPPGSIDPLLHVHLPQLAGAGETGRLNAAYLEVKKYDGTCGRAGECRSDDIPGPGASARLDAGCPDSACTADTCAEPEKSSAIVSRIVLRNRERLERRERGVTEEEIRGSIGNASPLGYDPLRRDSRDAV